MVSERLRFWIQKFPLSQQESSTEMEHDLVSIKGEWMARNSQVSNMPMNCRQERLLKMCT